MRRVLIANRGEIARRVIRAAHALGIRTVAVYAAVDAGAAFVEEADLAVPLTSASPQQAYLDGRQILRAARAAGADAVHPGYGFLAEHAGFAQMVCDAGLVWAGPSPAVIATMGDKLASLEQVRGLGIPVLPRADGAHPRGARDVGFPLLVKAAAGGGGRGMRRVDAESDLEDAISSAQAEARGAFGDGRVFLERLVAPARHVEVQVLGDGHGTVHHLFERECSIQRRYQKIIEEAPSPFLDSDTRERMCRAAVDIARSVSYQGAGTVEFVVDATGRFFFLEMNTRLQVEHPVTEAVTGVDIVRQQLLVAMGEALELGDVQVDGAAIEARLCAEDPSRDFLPTGGQLVCLREAPGVRIDSGVRSGDTVGSHFDPLLAKVVAHAPSRREAASRLAHALEDIRVHGVVTNRDFLVAVLRHDAFAAGDTTTDFIARHAPARERVPSAAEVQRAAITAAITARRGRVDARQRRPAIPAGWRNVRSAGEVTDFRHGVTDLHVELEGDDGGSLSGACAGQPFRAVVERWAPPELDLVIDEVRHRLTVVHASGTWWIQGADGEVRLEELPRFPHSTAEAEPDGLVAPMQGVVVEVCVAPGQRVHPGDVVAVIEAMKMLQPVTASEAGEVREVRVGVGSSVSAGDLLAVLEAHADATGVDDE